ncbi:MAG: hypothetical protein HY874_08895 [Chloroflexi bacterium]|nr:hypothetical protein [Chloroflexota bacterium]
MAKRKQRPPRSARAQSAAKPPHGPTALGASGMHTRPAWRWRTFPVFFAFVTGMLLAGFLNGAPTNTTAALAQIAAVAGFGYALAHLFVANVIIAGREKRRRLAMERGEEPAEDFEEELVYTAETPRD